MPTTFAPFDTGPLLTSVGYDRDGNACSRFQLKLLGETPAFYLPELEEINLQGLYPKWHRRWADLLRGKREYTFPLTLTRMQFKALDTRKKYILSGRVYLIKEMTATQTHKGLVAVRLTVVQVG